MTDQLYADHLPATLPDWAVASMHAMATGTPADLERLIHPTGGEPRGRRRAAGRETLRPDSRR